VGENRDFNQLIKNVIINDNQSFLVTSSLSVRTHLDPVRLQLCMTSITTASGGGCGMVCLSQTHTHTHTHKGCKLGPILAMSFISKRE